MRAAVSLLAMGTGPQANRAVHEPPMRAARRVVLQAAEEGREDKGIHNVAIASNLVKGRTLMGRREGRGRDGWRALTDLHPPAGRDHAPDGRHHAGGPSSLPAVTRFSASAS